jgi:hypothetical protein
LVARSAPVSLYVYVSPTDVRIPAEPAELDGGEVIAGFRVPSRRLCDDVPESPAIAQRKPRAPSRRKASVEAAQASEKKSNEAR